MTKNKMHLDPNFAVKQRAESPPCALGAPGWERTLEGWRPGAWGCSSAHANHSVLFGVV